MTANQNHEELFLGLDIGGTKCSVVLGDASFSIKRKLVFDTRIERGYQAILDEFMAHIDTMLAGDKPTIQPVWNLYVP